MQRFAVVAIALTALATPAMSSHTPAVQLNRAQAHVEALDREIDQVRHPGVRAQLEDRVDRIERLLRRIERSGVRGPIYGERPPHLPPHGPPGRPGFIDYEDALHMVRRESFDQDKLRIIQDLGGRMHLTTHQARALAGELAFDSNRADALIALYPSVTDPHRFRLALDVLTFSSSRRHVARTLGV